MKISRQIWRSMEWDHSSITFSEICDFLPFSAQNGALGRRIDWKIEEPETQVKVQIEWEGWHLLDVWNLIWVLWSSRPTPSQWSLCHKPYKPHADKGNASSPNLLPHQAKILRNHWSSILIVGPIRRFRYLRWPFLVISISTVGGNLILSPRTSI